MRNEMHESNIELNEVAEGDTKHNDDTAALLEVYDASESSDCSETVLDEPEDDIGTENDNGGTDAPVSNREKETLQGMRCNFCAVKKKALGYRFQVSTAEWILHGNCDKSLCRRKCHCSVKPLSQNINIAYY